MIYNQSSDKMEWGHMKMPEIIIDSDNESAIKIYDNEQYDNRFLETHREESNRLSCKSNLDDVDSGIHESNETFLPGMNNVLHSNRLSLRDMKKRSNLSEVRSYSTNCLPVDYTRYKEGLGLTDPRLCRICSTKTYSKKPSDNSKRDLKDIQFTIRDVVSYPEIRPRITSRESFQHKFCKIRVLLICMKILLGSTMTALGIFLFLKSDNIKLKDCAFWASGPLFLSGLFEVFIYFWRHRLKKSMQICHVMTIICGVMSFVCFILCLISSIISGIHGNWISVHSTDCYSDESPITMIQDLCCYDSKDNISQCICRDIRTSGTQKLNITLIYNNLNCRYLFFAVKDYLILQCALMGVGSGVCLWLLQMTIQRLLHECETAIKNSKSQHIMDDQNCVEQSPVIPLKIRCVVTDDKSQIFNDIIRVKSEHNQTNIQQLIEKYDN